MLAIPRSWSSMIAWRSKSINGQKQNEKKKNLGGLGLYDDMPLLNVGNAICILHSQNVALASTIAETANLARASSQPNRSFAPLARSLISSIPDREGKTETNIRTPNCLLPAVEAFRGILSIRAMAQNERNVTRSSKKSFIDPRLWMCATNSRSTCARKIAVKTEAAKQVVWLGIRGEYGFSCKVGMATARSIQIRRRNSTTVIRSTWFEIYLFAVSSGAFRL